MRKWLFASEQASKLNALWRCFKGNHNFPWSRLRSGGGTLGVDGRDWGPAGEHWAWMVVVEVRQVTLGVEWSRLRSGREHWAGWVVVEVLAGNTGRGWSWLRSGRERWRGWVVVDTGRGWSWFADEEQDEEDEGGRGRGGQATNIKSNKPHLAGGEKNRST